MELEQESPEHYALRLYHSAIIDIIAQNLSDFSVKFIEHALAPAPTVRGIQTALGLYDTDKASRLYDMVNMKLSLPRTRVKGFETFLTILAEEAAFMDLAKQIMKKYGKY